MTGLEPGTVTLSEPDPEWRALFERERDRIKTAVGPVALDIQHIGSTSIPGIAAKPIVDIAVAIVSFEAFDVHVPVIEKLGYIYRGEHGIPRRHYFVLGEPRVVHLHFLEISGEQWRDHLVFRETMRARPDLREAYMNLKRDLVKRFADDRDGYTAGKREFIRGIIGDVVANRAPVAREPKEA